MMAKSIKDTFNDIVDIALLSNRWKQEKCHCNGPAKGEEWVRKRYSAGTSNALLPLDLCLSTGRLGRNRRALDDEFNRKGEFHGISPRSERAGIDEPAGLGPENLACDPAT